MPICAAAEKNTSSFRQIPVKRLLNDFCFLGEEVRIFEFPDVSAFLAQIVVDMNRDSSLRQLAAEIDILANVLHVVGRLRLNSEEWKVQLIEDAHVDKRATEADNRDFLRS